MLALLRTEACSAVIRIFYDQEEKDQDIEGSYVAGVLRFAIAFPFWTEVVPTFGRKKKKLNSIMEALLVLLLDIPVCLEYTSSALCHSTQPNHARLPRTPPMVS